VSERRLTIALPPANGVDRELLCQVALEPAFESICSLDPERHWKGDESEFWLIRASATHAHWTPEEIDDALIDLAANRHLGLLSNRLTDEQIAEIKRRMTPPPRQAAPPPQSSKPYVLLGAAVTAAAFALAMMLGLI